MTNDIQSEAAAQVVEQLALRQALIDIDAVRYLAGEVELSVERRRQIELFRGQPNGGFSSELVLFITGIRYPETQAQIIWSEIIAHRDLLRQVLDRNPGVMVAALDWLTNCRDGKTNEFMFIECEKLENVLELAAEDGLTGLYNHQTFVTLFEKEISRARRHAISVSLLMLDVDDFKSVNDRFGHQKGDEVLIRLAQIFRETVRTMDVACRYGGEEFAIILPQTERPAAIQCAQRIREAVEVQFRTEGNITISIGVACFGDQTNTSSSLVKKADDALYQAKAKGKNCVVAG